MTPFKNNFVLAKYTPTGNPAYAGNPFIEHLGDLPDDKSLAKSLTQLPTFNSSMRSLPANQRIDLLSSVHDICVPLPRLVDLARSVFKLMREGYRPRKPYSREDNAIIKELFGAQKHGLESNPLPAPSRADLGRQMSMALAGASGCGKSFGLNKIAGLVDEVIYHEEFGKWQLPFVFVEMSYDGESVHTLASSLFDELDRLLPDAHYAEMYSDPKRMNAELRLAKALALCYEHGVGALVIDEAQNQQSIGNEGSTRRKANRAKETPLMKLLVTASNTSHIPLIFSGTLELEKAVGARFTRLRRMAGNGSATWLPLQRSGSFAVPGEFEMLLLALWQYQFTKTPVQISDEWGKLMWDVTQGIPDIMVKLWSASQEAAIATQKEVLTPELVARAFDAQFSMVAMPLKALRESNETVLSMIPDLALSAAESEITVTKYPAKKAYPAPLPAKLKDGPLTDIRENEKPLTAEVVPGGVLV